MGQIMKSLFLSVCLSVCDLSCGRNSHSILMKLCTVVWNPKSKIEFVRGQNPTTPSPIFHPRNALSMAGLNTTVSSPVDRLWRLIAERTLLGGRCTGTVEKCCTLMFLAVNWKQRTRYFESVTVKYTVSGKKNEPIVF